MTEYQKRVVQALIGLVYQKDDFDLNILQKFIGKKIGDKFFKLGASRPGIKYVHLINDWVMDIITNMSGEEAFFSNWKFEYPNSNKIDKEKLFKKFKDKIEKQVQKLYEKYLKDLINGYGLDYQGLEQLPEQLSGQLPEEADDLEE